MLMSTEEHGTGLGRWRQSRALENRGTLVGVRQISAEGK